MMKYSMCHTIVHSLFIVILAYCYIKMYTRQKFKIHKTENMEYYIRKIS